MDTYSVNSTCIYYDNNQDPTMCGKYSPNNDCLCADHAHLRSKLQDYISVDRKEVIKKVKEMLQECQVARGTSNKAKICDKLFTYLTKHKKFLSNHKKFEDTVYKKLLEFEVYKPMFDSQKFIAELFPNYYGQSQTGKVLTSPDHDSDADDDDDEFTVSI